MKSLKGYYLFAQISGLLLCSVFGAFGFGFWLDKQLGTTPWLSFLLIIAGTALGMYTIFRIIKGQK